MKWIFSACFLFLSVTQRSVFGVRPLSRAKDIISLEIEPVKYEPSKTFLEEGVTKKITCKGSHEFQKLEWYDPSGNLVKKEPSNRVYVQERIGTFLKRRSPTLDLVFTHVLLKDSGVWECRAGNMIQEVPLCVMVPSEFVETQNEIAIDAGRSITLSCQATGDPEPKIEWYRDGQLIVGDDEKLYTSTKYNHHGFEGLLTIKSLTPEDGGQYICKATQEYPELDTCSHSVMTDITLNVNYQPNFERKLETTYVFAQYNKSVQLVCAPKAYPAPKFRWFRDNGAILTEYSDKEFKVSDDGSQSTLILIANSSSFDKKFRCHAQNIYGEDAQQFQLLELQKPARLNEINIVNATDDTIIFNVTWHDEDDYFPVEGFQILYLEKTTTGQPRDRAWNHAEKLSFELTDKDIFEMENLLIPLSGLEEETEYWVKLRAVNDLGVSPWSAPVLASTLSREELDNLEEDDFPIEDAFLSNVPVFGQSVGVFVGILLTCIIVIAGAICIFFVKRL
ncbi:Down syndrome cell adhesion molecule homolog [Pectinophora gossypiella]|uniref:Down syndrome cell adhesion molecule homolog n=1 Tax=Pectinophora gossypiella TaxID=13191 RepID=UPI00214E90B0|nr:Down syndrome cell adhesion molecule homolog [Pectinophora gossypiella]